MSRSENQRQSFIGVTPNRPNKNEPSNIMPEDLERRFTPQKLIAFLSNPDIFQPFEVRVIAYDVSDMYPWIHTKDAEQTELAQEIVTYAIQHNKTSDLRRFVWKQRPYLKDKDAPEKFSPQQINALKTDLVTIFAHQNEDKLRVLLNNLKINHETIDFNKNSRYSQFVESALKTIERLDLTQHRIVRSFIKQIAKEQKLLKPSKQTINSKKIEAKVANYQFINEDQVHLSEVLNRLASSDIRNISTQYDIESVATDDVSIPKRVSLLLDYTWTTRTQAKLVATIHTLYGHVDLKRYGLQRRIRQPKDIPGLEKYQNKHNYPTDFVSENTANAFTTFYWQNKDVIKPHGKQICKVLGYDTESESQTLLKAYYTAIERSEIHLLCLEIQELTDVTFPAEIFKQ